jgi:flavin reductase (DIM6/NTAB) family NADH-FMN oxidoreductase RutF
MAHADIAAKLSKPGEDHSSLFSNSPFSLPQPSSSLALDDNAESALPILEGAIGTMTCEVVSSTLLRDVYPTTQIDEDSIPFDEEVEGAGLRAQPEKQHDGGGHPFPPNEVHGSELFICRVLDVKHGNGAETPMVYYKHQYVTVKE